MEIIYELATPTTDEAVSFTQRQRINDWGTEQFIVDDIDNSIPVGHSTRYYANLRDKLQHLPSTASTPGTYVISVDDNGQMSLIPYPITSIQYPYSDGV